jgi:DNA polymerase-3 subunit alpha
MSRQKQYSPLHLHSATGSHLDGMIRIPELVTRCKELSIPAIAVTDHGSMGAIIEATKNFKGSGIKLIYGFEPYLANDRFNKIKTEPRFHLILLAKNQEGLKNLLKLTSIGFSEGFYYKPRLDWEVLEKYSGGLVCSSACAGGPVSQQILRDDESETYFMIDRLKSIFKDDFYLEMQPTREVWQQKINKVMYKVAKETQTPLIITPDSHYLKKEDFNAHELMLCIQTKALISDPTGEEISVASSEDSDEAGSRKKRFSFKVPDYFVYSAEDIYEYFDQYHSEVPTTTVDEALYNTLVIADKCNAEYELGQDLYPSFEVERNVRKYREYCEWQKLIRTKNLISEPAYNLL